MSIKDLVSGLEDRVDHLFTAAEPVAPATLREPVLRGIARAEDQWASPSPGLQPDWFSESNGSVAFTPTLPNGAPLTIDGLTTNFIPADRFADYLVNMRRAVEAGEFDAEIAAGAGGSPNVSGLATVAMPEARQGTSQEIRQAQRDEALAREGRNPDGSLARATDSADRVPNDRLA